MTKLSPYQLRCLEQTKAWVDGRSIHNAEDDECCPDFSCCHPDLFEKDIEMRRALLQELQETYALVQ